MDAKLGIILNGSEFVLQYLLKRTLIFLLLHVVAVLPVEVKKTRSIQNILEFIAKKSCNCILYIELCSSVE
jgi:hypothetical protein